MRNVIAILLAGLVMLAAPAVARNKPVQAFSGEYDWKDGGSDTLKAEFRPADDGNWKVEFTFQFGGKSNTWKGTATGSLADQGVISGTAGWKGRSWVFEATVEDGVMRGSHTEIQRGGERYDTGTFSLKR